jgi:hypothetical protein
MAEDLQPNVYHPDDDAEEYDYAKGTVLVELGAEEEEEVPYQNDAEFLLGRDLNTLNN